MKKLLTLVSCLVLSLCITLSVGCSGGKDAFDGNYQEATAAQVNSFAQEIPVTGEELSLASGVKLEAVMNITMGEGYYSNTEMSFIIAEQDNVLKMSGTASSDNKIPGFESIKASGNIYYNDDTLYIEENGNKYYQTLPLDSFLEGYTSELEELDEVLEEFDDILQGVSYYMEQTPQTTKIKIVIDDVNGLDSTMYFIYDVNNTLTGIKLESTTTSSYGTTEMVVSMELYEGSVSLPNNLDEYNTIYPDYSFV